MHMLRSAFAAAALALAVSAPAQTAVQIHDIMTNLPNSPYLGQSVSVTGVVVGVMTAGGIYITAQDANWDSNQATAEGMPIFYPTGGYPTCAVVGNVVTLVGTVVNGTAENGADTPGTGLNPTSCTVTGTDVVTRNVALPTGLSSFGQLLPYTGMPFSNTTLFAVAPTGGTLDIPTETVTSNGQFWATFVQSANFHTFRSAGIAEDEFVPAGAPSGITRWSGNPQRIFVDTTTFGGAPVDIGSGQTLTCTVPPGISAGSTSGVGVVDYSLGYLRLLVFPTTQCAVSGSISPAVAAPADAQHFHVGSLNLNRFYNTLGNAFGAVPLTPTAYARQLAKVAIAINTELGQPDIVCLQDVQDLATLTDIANALRPPNGVVPSYAYVPYLDMGNDTTTSLNLGFLVKTNTIVVDSVVQYGLNDTYTTASNGTALLWNEPPLVLNAEVKRAGENYQVSVINQEILSRGLEDIDDPVLGPDIRARRGAQAVALSQLSESLQDMGDNLLVAGNFNEYSFNDGFVDVSDIILGNPAAANNVVLYEPTYTTSKLYNFENNVAGGTKYNIIENGNARSIEHIFVSDTVNPITAADPLFSYATTITQPHFTTDYPAVTENDPTTAAGLTLHDGFVAAFLIPPVPTYAAISPATVNFGNVDLTASATQPVTVTNTTTFPSNVVVQSIAISGTNAGDFTQTSNCTIVLESQSCTINVVFAPTATGARTATLTVTTDSPNDPTLTSTLNGTGLDTTAILAPATANFGSVQLGVTSPAQSFTVTNTSATGITVSTLAATSNFNITGGTCAPGLPLAASSSCTVTLNFAPTSVGPIAGTLTVTDTSTANGTLTSALTGTGLPTTATLTPAAVAYANTIVGNASAAQSVTWTNTSLVPLTISSVNISGNFTIVSNTCTGAIAAGATCAVSANFTPLNLGPLTGSLTIVSTSTANGSLTTTLSGNGIAALEASPASLSFGNQDLTSISQPQTTTITNMTTAAITLNTISVQGDYPYSTTCGITLGSLASCTVTVSFAPTTLGSRPGSIIVTGSAAASVTVPLGGNGVDFALSINPTSGHVIAGDTLQTVATLSPLGGYDGFVSLSCTTNAGGSQCTPVATPVQVGGTVHDTFVITTTSQYTVIGYQGLGLTRNPWSWLALLLGAFGMFAIRRPKAALIRCACLCLMLSAMLLGSTGCSGKLPARNANPTYPGSYTYTVTATDGTLTHTATYSLSVSVD